MIELKRSKRLKKELRLLDVYAIATGTTLSAGFFLLPGLAAVEAGPGVILAYMIAAIPLIPAMFSIVELGTAMPRAGGVYYFLDRTLGPMMGTIGGIGTWLALILKVSFALIGMGAYISLFLPELPIIPVAVFIAILLGVVSIFGSKKSGRLQIILVACLLIILIYFIFNGITEINFSQVKAVFKTNFQSLISTAGLVYISYVGVTNVASLSEEVKKPERNLPLGIFLSLGTAIIIYFLGTSVMVGVIPMEQFRGDLTPVATAAGNIFGKTGIIVISIAALFAFISVANGGTLSASRYPLALSRDHMMPRFFQKLGSQGTPVISIIFTICSIVLILLFLNPTRIAKLASAFQLLMFAFICFAVIVIRESKIESYDPGFKSPLYPWMQIVGIILPLGFIAEMGWIPFLFIVVMIFFGVAWYWYYARKKVVRNGAIYHIFERLGRMRYAGLDSELRGILKEKGLRENDPFNEIVVRSLVIDLNEKTEFEDVVTQASKWIAQFGAHTPEEIKKQFMDGTRMGATPVTHGIALPHLRLKGLQQAEMVLVRSKPGVHIIFNNPLTDFEQDEETISAVFFLVSPEHDPTQHLRILAQIAGRVDEDDFKDEWLNAQDEQQLKEALLHEERCLSIVLSKEARTSHLVGQVLKNINFPEGCLIALLRRDGQTIIPRGNTLFKEGDRLTIIGDPNGMKTLRKKYGESF